MCWVGSWFLFLVLVLTCSWLHLHVCFLNTHTLPRFPQRPSESQLKPSYDISRDSTTTWEVVIIVSGTSIMVKCNYLVVMILGAQILVNLFPCLSTSLYRLANGSIPVAQPIKNSILFSNTHHATTVHRTIVFIIFRLQSVWFIEQREQLQYWVGPSTNQVKMN